MGKILIGVATGALWFVLSHAANAEEICRKVCDDGSCISRCVDRPDNGVIVREHEEHYDRDRDDRPGLDVHVPGVGIEIGH